MADLLSLLQSLTGSSSSSTSSSSSSSSTSQLDQLAAAYQQTLEPKVTALNQKVTDLQNKQTFFNSLNTKINALIGNIDSFTISDASSKFGTRSVTSSDNSILTATATSDANLGVNSVKVDRLASSDLLISDSMAFAGATTLTPGDYSFTINGVPGTVSLTADDNTNGKVMQKLANAINNTANIGVTASYIKIDSTSSKVTLTSTTTGSSNDIQFSDSAILGNLGITNAALNPHTTSRTAATDTTAGYKTSDYNNLDSKIEINGISIYRTSNSINDALPGVTLNLLKPQDTTDQAVTLTTSVDNTAVENLIQPFIGAYNDLLNYLKQNPTMLRGDSAMSGLNSKLRLTTSSAVTSANSGDPQYLSDIGIKTNSDGTLSISNHDRLLELLKEDPQKVANLFTSSDSFVSKVNNVISNLTGNNGLILSRTMSIGQQIDTTQKRANEAQQNIDKQVESYKKQYTSMLSLYYKAQEQYSLLSSSTSTGTTLA